MSDASDQDTSPELDALDRAAESLEGDYIAGGESSSQEQERANQQQQTEMLAEVIGGLLDVTCNNLLAPKRGDHWKMGKDESKGLGEAYAAVIDKYFPDINIGVELTAVFVTAACFGPRMAIDAKLRRKAKAEAAEKGGDGSAKQEAA